MPQLVKAYKSDRQPKISVVIPLYNKGDYIENTLRSVIAQNYQEFEVIVVNDGSTDDGPIKVRCIQDPRIKIVDQKNAGVSAARNRGVYEARSEFIAFLDADDEWHKEYLSHINSLTSCYPECDVFACSWAFKDGEKIVMPRFKHIPKHHGILVNYLRSLANGESPLWTSSVVVRKRIFDVVGLFDINSGMGEDIDLWYKLSKKAKIAFYNKTLAYYNLAADNRLCEHVIPEKDLPFFDSLRVDIQNTRSYRQKYYLKKFLAKSFHNIAKNNIKKGRFLVAFKQIQQAPYIPNRETLKCLVWLFLFFLKGNRAK